MHTRVLPEALDEKVGNLRREQMERWGGRHNADFRTGCIGAQSLPYPISQSRRDTLSVPDPTVRMNTFHEEEKYHIAKPKLS